MEKSEFISDISTALCKFQGAVEKIKKEANNPFFKSKYASLANILDIIRQPLFDNGLSFVQFPTGENQLTTMLMHTSGQYISDTYTMKPVKSDPQGLGSCITYMRRYALGAILGLNIDDDDDGNKASGLNIKQQSTKESQPTMVIQPKLPPQGNYIQNIINSLNQETDTSLVIILNDIKGASSIEQLSMIANSYPDLLMKDSRFSSSLTFRKNEIKSQQSKVL